MGIYSFTIEKGGLFFSPHASDSRLCIALKRIDQVAKEDTTSCLLCKIQDFDIIAHIKSLHNYPNMWFICLECKDPVKYEDFKVHNIKHKESSIFRYVTTTVRTKENALKSGEFKSMFMFFQV